MFSPAVATAGVVGAAEEAEEMAAAMLVVPPLPMDPRATAHTRSDRYPSAHTRRQDTEDRASMGCSNPLDARGRDLQGRMGQCTGRNAGACNSRTLLTAACLSYASHIRRGGAAHVNAEEALACGDALAVTEGVIAVLDHALFLLRSRRTV